MDKEEFKRRLAEVADFEQPIIKIDSEQRRKLKGRKSAEDSYQEEHEAVFLDLYNGINPTQQPQLVRIKPYPTECKACGKICENGCHQEKKMYDLGGIKHWRERCLTCGMNQNPHTGKWDLDSKVASAIWANWARSIQYRNKVKLAQEQKSKE